MQNPVFKLEKVVRSKSEEEMQDFEGPLDLILYLLGKNKMEIQDISISLICDQYHGVAGPAAGDGSGGGQRVRHHGLPTGVHQDPDASLH